VEYFRVRRAKRYTLNISDPKPIDSIQDVWRAAARAATIGIFLLLFGAFVYVGRSILMPLTAAAVLALTFAPLVRHAKRRGIPPPITALAIVVVALGALGMAATALVNPVKAWIARAPEIGGIIRERLSVLEKPLAALHELAGALSGGNEVTVNSSSANVVLPAVAFLTPAAGELLLFFAALLFFLVGLGTLARTPSRCFPAAAPSCGSSRS